MNKKRQNTAAFRLSDSERQVLKDRIKNSGMSSQEFLLRSSLERPIMNVEVFQALLVELRKQGTNLNQIAKACNSGRQIDAAESAKAAARKIERTVQSLRFFYEMESRGVDLSRLKKACDESAANPSDQDKKILEELKTVWPYLKL